MSYTIEKVTTLIGARRYGTADGNIRWLLTDSRSVCFPEETLFSQYAPSVTTVTNILPTCTAAELETS